MPSRKALTTLKMQVRGDLNPKAKCGIAGRWDLHGVAQRKSAAKGNEPFAAFCAVASASFIRVSRPSL